MDMLETTSLMEWTALFFCGVQDVHHFNFLQAFGQYTQSHYKADGICFESTWLTDPYPSQCILMCKHGDGELKSMKSIWDTHSKSIQS